MFIYTDIKVAELILAILDMQRGPIRQNRVIVAFSWVLNPLVIAISTRGSNDQQIVYLVFLTIYYILHKDYTKAALVYGLSVHFKIYPIIYSFALFLFIDS